MNTQHKHIDRIFLTDRERQTIIVDADGMLDGKYCFDGIWDMERCREAVENKMIRWDVRYNGDPEWSYMFTRMDYLYKLILSTELTEKVSYLRHGLKIIDCWWKAHWVVYSERLHRGRVIPSKLRRGDLGCRTLDMAIMASNMVDYVTYCHQNGHITERKYNWYKKKLWNLLACLIEKLWIPNKLLSNWGIIESANIIYCYQRLWGHMPEHVYNELRRQVAHQILTDGSNIESSPFYLVQVLLVLLKILNISDDNHRQELVPIVAQGAKYVMSIRTLENCIPMLGDSDKVPIDDLMVLTSRILDRKEFSQAIARNLDIEFAVKYGICRENLPIADTNSQAELVNYRYQTVYRAEASGSYLLCSNTPPLWSDHKHYDYMSILWSEFGKDVLTDLGRFTYMECEERQFLKGPDAHNTINIIDTPFYKYIGSMSTWQQVGCHENAIVGEGKNWLAVRMHQALGYSAVDIYRYVVYIHQRGLIVTDIVNQHNDGDYRYKTCFNIGHGFTVRETGKHLTLDDGDGHTLSYMHDHQATVALREVMWSGCYNEQRPARQIVSETVGPRQTHFFLLAELGGGKSGIP